MNTEVLILKKVKIDSKLSDTQKEECTSYVTELLDSDQHKPARQRLENDKKAVGVGYWNEEKGHYELRIDYFGPAPSEPKKVAALSYVVE